MRSTARTTRFFPAEWKCHPVNEIYVHEFLDLAESHRIPVFLLIPPVAPAAQARLDELGASARYTRFMEGVLARHRGVVAIDGRGSKYPVDAFYDSSHLNRVGTADLSNALADALKARLDGPAPADRWVTLAAFDGGKGQEKIEDFMDSYGNILAAQKEKGRRSPGRRRGEGGSTPLIAETWAAAPRRGGWNLPR